VRRDVGSSGEAERQVRGIGSPFSVGMKGGRLTQFARPVTVMGHLAARRSGQDPPSFDVLAWNDDTAPGTYVHQ